MSVSILLQIGERYNLWTAMQEPDEDIKDFIVRSNIFLIHNLILRLRKFTVTSLQKQGEINLFVV